MKSVLIFIVVLAVSAFVAPSPEKRSIFIKVFPVAESADTATNRAQPEVDIIKVVTKDHKKMKSIITSINSTIARIRSGTISREEGAKTAAHKLENLLEQLSGIVPQVVIAVDVQGLKAELVGFMDAVGNLARTLLWTAVVSITLDIIGFTRPINVLIHTFTSVVIHVLFFLAGAIVTRLMPSLIAGFQHHIIGSTDGLMYAIFSLSGLIFGLFLVALSFGD